MKATIVSLIFLFVTAVPNGGAQNPMKRGGEKKPATSASSADQQKLDAILDELRQIRQLLADQNKYITERATAQRPAAPPVMEKVSLALGSGWYSLGSDSAPVTLMEFADFQCPYCRRFHTDSFAELKKNYIDTGKVRFISRDLPLEFHPNAMNAALAARCAGDQDKYWQLRDTMISNSKDLSRDAVLKYAKDTGLDMTTFGSCLDSAKYKSEIEKDRDEAGKLGISGTPSFVIGRTNKETLDGVKIVGAMPYSAFDSKIRELLAAQP